MSKPCALAIFTTFGLWSFAVVAAGGDKLPAKGPIAFKTISGEENGSKSILDKRKAEVMEKKGGKLSGHNWWLWGLTGIDYDRDGDPDFIVTIHGPAGHGVFVRNQLRETGKLTFENVTRELGVDWQLPSAEGRRSFVWDFDGDGWLDFSGLHTPDFLNQAGKKFVPTAKKAFGSFGPQAIIDLNGDGHPDVFNTQGGNGIWDPAAKIFKLQPFEDPLKDKAPESVQRLWKNAKDNPLNRFQRVKFYTHDLDGDGAAEVVVAGYASYGGDAFGRYLRKDKAGALVDATKEMGLPENGTPILVKDIDGDGFLDLLIAAHADGGFFRSDAKGGFRLQAGPLTDFLRGRESYLHRAVTADFDNDGRLDLVVTKPRLGQTHVFGNRGDGVFETVLKANGWDSDPVVLCDLDDDGRLDLAIGGPGNQITLYLNATSGAGPACRLSPRMPAPNVYAVGTKVEVFRAGALGKSRPIFSDEAHADATPIHIGLGAAKRIDLRVTFPGATPIELRDVEALERLQVTPDGKVASK